MNFLENITHIIAEINNFKVFNTENVIKLCNRYLKSNISNFYVKTNISTFKDENNINNDTILFRKAYTTNSIDVLFSFCGDELIEEEKSNLEIISDLLFNKFDSYISEQRLKEAAYFDVITESFSTIGIVNFMADKKLVDYACLFLSINRFKDINRKYGFSNGNLLLHAYANELKKFLSEDETFGRPGGDNFIILVKKERLDLLIATLDYITLEVEIGGETQLIPMKYRAGIYEIKEDNNIFYAIDCAAEAVNVCKTLKESNVFYFTENFAVKISLEQQILNSFNKAMEDEEFKIFYQPKVNVNKKEICGAEALVRWQKNNNFISPANFIPLLEREGLINRLDMYMFEHVCKDIASFLENGIEPVRVSVNFSRIDLKNEFLYDQIITIIDKYKIDEKYIEIEITETSILEDKKILHPFIEKLSRRGITITVDDFGTGYSSLNFIKEYPFDVIKIDKAFIDSVDISNPKNVLFFKNIVNLIRGLDMEIVVEGVENVMQIEYLKNMGCNIIQGYIFDKPLLKEKFVERLINRFY